MWYAHKSPMRHGAYTQCADSSKTNKYTYRDIKCKIFLIYW